MQNHQATGPQPEADQTVRLQIDTAGGCPSIRTGFTDQRLTAHGGMVLWSHFLHQKRFRHELAQVLPHDPTSPDAYVPTDLALVFVGGVLCGTDKLSRVAWLQSDPAVAEVLGIEAVPSQSTLSRFFGIFTQPANNRLAWLHGWAAGKLASQKEGYTLDLDSWALLHKDGQQPGVVSGYTQQGLKPCHRPLIAALAEAKRVVNFWLRQGNRACINGAANFLRATLQGLPAHIRVGLLRADSGFANESFFGTAEQAGLSFIVVAPLTRPIQRLCRHTDAHWQPTELPGVEVQEIEGERPGRRWIVIRQRMAQRPEAGGKTLFDLPSYRFQALWTNLPRSVGALGVWRRYRGRADVENRIKELGDRFGIKGLCCQSFWATEALYHLAIAAYNLCVLLQRRLGQLEKVKLNTLCWRLFARAAVWSRARGKPTLKLAVRGKAHRAWWREILSKLTALPNCHAVGSLSA